jgi:hypothetical protein
MMSVTPAVELLGTAPREIGWLLCSRSDHLDATTVCPRSVVTVQ